MDTPRNLTNVRRSWLERVLDVVRELGACADLTETLERITRAVVEVLDFDAAAVNVAGPDGMVRVEAVAGPPDAARRLMGKTSPLSAVQALIDASEQWGALRFFGHERDQSVFEKVPAWTPDAPTSTDPDAWQPDDSLFAPLWAQDGSLLGVLSVDQPRSGRRPDLEQRTVLELFAGQAASAIAESSARRRAEARQRDAELRWHLAFERSPIGAAVVALDGRLQQVNASLARMLGYAPHQLERLSIADITHPDDIDLDLDLFSQVVAGERDSYEMEKRYLHRDGQIVWGILHVGVIRAQDGSVESVVGLVNDVTARKHAEETLTHRATHDPLTGLPNRAMLEQLLGYYLTEGRPAGVLSCDLDRFKTINDSLGHDAGDELLMAAALRLVEAVPAGATVGRVGGDEFVVLAPDADGFDALRALGATIATALARPLLVAGHEHAVAVSVGITVSGPWHDHPDQVLRQADQALLRAKRQGRARIEVYDPAQDQLATVDDLELEQSLRGALVDGEGLIPYFQPIISMGEDRPVGYEALVRWQHPVRGMLEPDDFVPIAEQSGLVVALGWWMLDQGCLAAARLRGSGCWVSVNASGSQLGRQELVPAVAHALAASDLPPERLHLEITETALVDASPAVLKEVDELADMGVHIALDDFGTGYSSLSLLRNLPVSAVKIDRSFIAPIAVDHTATAIVRSLIGLCRELGITTIAEGVETEMQLTTLRALGCAQVQGYLIGRPAPLDELDALGTRRILH